MALKWIDPWAHLPAFKVYIKSLRGFSQKPSRCSQQHLTLSRLQGWVLEHGSHCGKGGQNVHSRNGEVVRKLIAQVQLMGQLAVTSSWWPPPINIVSLLVLITWLLGAYISARQTEFKTRKRNTSYWVQERSVTQATKALHLKKVNLTEFHLFAGVFWANEL